MAMATSAVRDQTQNIWTRMQRSTALSRSFPQNPPVLIAGQTGGLALGNHSQIFPVQR